MTVRVLIADDNPVVRAGLRSLLELEPDIEPCGEASSGPEALALAQEHRPDVVLLDVRMPGGGGIEVLPEVAQIAKVLMLTYSDEPAIVTTALSSGATGYIVHGAFESAELATAIRDTAHGSARLSPTAAAAVLNRLRSGPEAAPAPAEAVAPGTIDAQVARRFAISRRELDIAQLMVRGASNSEIAGELYIEEKTVKNHINRLFAKLGASGRHEAIAVLLGLKDA